MRCRNARLRFQELQLQPYPCRLEDTANLTNETPKSEILKCKRKEIMPDYEHSYHEKQIYDKL